MNRCIIIVLMFSMYSCRTQVAVDQIMDDQVTPRKVEVVHTDHVKLILRQAKELEEEAMKTENRLASLRRAIALYNLALKIDVTNEVSLTEIARLSKMPEVIQRRTEIERELLRAAILGLKEDVVTLLKELKDIDPLAPDVKSLGEGEGVVMRFINPPEGD